MLLNFQSDEDKGFGIVSDTDGGDQRAIAILISVPSQAKSIDAVRI